MSQTFWNECVVVAGYSQGNVFTRIGRGAGVVRGGWMVGLFTDTMLAHPPQTPTAGNPLRGGGGVFGGGGGSQDERGRPGVWAH